MFEAVRKNKRISQVILAIIIVPFAFFGMDAYFSDSPGGAEVAKVGGSTVNVFEFDQALREQQDRLRNLAGGQIDPAVFQTDQFRRSVLENLINQRVLAMHAQDNRLVITQEALQQAIGQIEAFQEEGRFSLTRYEALLRAQGMTPAMFEASVAQDLRVQQIARAVSDSAFVGETSVRQFLQAQLEERSVREVRFPTARYHDSVQVTEEQIASFYQGNLAQYQQPARMKVDYVIFDDAALMSRIDIADAQVEAFYQGNQERFGQPEERRARHILIQLATGADPAEEAEAVARAEALLARVRENESAFADIAEAESEDPGSARNGGDLGFFGRGVMVPAFEDAVFAMEKAQISDVVRSDFGLHIIQLTEIKPATVKPLEEVREEIRFELARQEAARQFALEAENFANMVYEQPDSLQPVVEAFGLELRSSDWISRQGSEGGPFADPRLLDALFSDMAIRDGHNIEAIEIERGTLVSARVTAYEEPRQRPLEEVRDSIEARLRAEESQRLAREEGEKALVALEAGEEVTLEWSDAWTMRRGEPGRAGEAVRAVFSRSAAALPAHVGVTGEDAYTVFRIEQVTRPEITAEDERLGAVTGEYQRLLGELEFSAFVEYLRSQYKVQVREAALRQSAD